MKKNITLILALVLCFALLAACGGKPEATDPPAATDAPAEVTDPPAQEPDDTDEDPADVVLEGTVLSIVPSTAAEGLMVIMDTWGGILEEAGCTYVVQSADGDTAKYISIIEDYVQGGDTILMLIAAEDTEALEDACKVAMEADIFVTMLGVEPQGYQISGGLNSDYGKTGEVAADMALTWIEENMDTAEKVPVAVNTYYNSVNSTARSEGFLHTIENSDVAYVDYEETFYDDMTNTAYNFAETALTQNPDIRVFLCYEPDSARGVDQYLAVYCAENDLTFDDFCVVCCYFDDLLVETVDKATEDSSVSAIKGYVTYGGTPTETGESLAEGALDLLTGSVKPPHWMWDPIFGTSTFGYVVVDE